MPYPKVEPVSDAFMRNTRYENHNSICQKLREIYTMTDNEDIKLRCRIATAMAKRMHEKLKKYKAIQIESLKEQVIENGGIK